MKGSKPISDAWITKISKVPSSLHGGDLFYIFFKGYDGKSYKTCTSTKYRNFSLWKPLCENPDHAVGMICRGLRAVSPGFVDADYLSKVSMPKPVEVLGAEVNNEKDNTVNSNSCA